MSRLQAFLLNFQSFCKKKATEEFSVKIFLSIFFSNEKEKTKQ